MSARPLGSPVRPFTLNRQIAQVGGGFNRHHEIPLAAHARPAAAALHPALLRRGDRRARALRLQVPPGITGLSQVCQAQGAEVTARLDAEYAARANPIWDVELLLRTVFNIVGKRRGAMRPPNPKAAA